MPDKLLGAHYYGAGDPGVTAKSEKDFAPITGREHKTPPKSSDDTKMTPGHPAFGRGTGNQ